MAAGTAQAGIPALDVASTARRGQVDIARMGANDWLLAVLAGQDVEAAATTVRVAAGDQFEPAQALLQHTGSLADVATALARVELDVCGAWVTLSCAGVPQPVVVRRAGWIDLRGQVAPLPGQLKGFGLHDDRVGLGPGDAIVLLGPELRDAVDEAGERFSAEWLPTALLRACTAPDARGVLDELSGALHRFNGTADLGPAAVVRVPVQTKEESARRVAEVTGLTAAELATTRYPLGEQLMSRRPAPPREARLQLAADLAHVSVVRALLRRLLASWRMDAGELPDDVQLLASEITANAIEHGQSPVTVIARYDGRCVRVEVGDGSLEAPARRQAEPFDEKGRGMFLVDAIAQAWGVLPTVHGKRVWFEIAVPPEAS
jgi:anti-sigma regulatory factor (Ser/Thr protein kinase)